MATTIARLQAILSADTKAFDRALDRSHKKTSGMGKAAGVAGAAIAGGLALGIRAGVKEFMEAERVGAQTNAVLKSTGGIARVSAKDVDRLAGSLMKKSGVDDEAIKSGENMLLTFTKIRNEQGKGNKIFDQATRATLDLSVAMGKDMNNSAILVGKALNDPIKGMTALRKIGVSFTEEQTEQVKAMIKGKDAITAITDVLPNMTAAQMEAGIKLNKTGASWEEIASTLKLKMTPAQREAIAEMTKGGDVMEAQKFILQELNTEFGGSAEAAGKTFAGQVNILRESFKNLMAVLVAQVFPHLTTLVKHLTAAVTYLSKNETQAKILIVALGGLATALLAARTAQILLNLAVLANPYVAAAASVVILTAALVVLWQKYENLRVLIIAFVARFTPLGAIILAVKDNWGLLMGAFDKAKGPLKAIEKGLDDIRRVIRAIINAIQWLGENVGAVFGKVGSAVGGVVGAVEGTIGRLNPRGEGQAPAGPSGPGGPIGRGQLPGGLVSAANRIDSQHFPYLWGGGHSPGTYNGPYDCSGAVSALLRAGGLMSGSMVSGQFMSYGDPGPGKAMSIYANREHVYAIINGRAWGTSGQNPGGGAGWFSGGPRSGFVVRHPPGFDTGGVVPGRGPQLIVAHGGETILPTHKTAAVENHFHFPQYLGSRQELMSALQNMAREFERRNGRSPF